MFEIRSARESDAFALAGISERTFVETFAKDNRPEDLAEYISETFGYEKQLAEIRDPRRLISIAWEGSRPAGFYHLYEGIPDPAVQGPRPVELLRLYVSSEWHGKGLGTLLMEKCLDEARAAGFRTLWLGVWERNFRAQAFYRKFDFIQCGSHVFQLGKDAQTDLILSRSL
jgi:ribosomal protein S18 acetylase RimI-like enzyme